METILRPFHILMGQSTEQKESELAKARKTNDELTHDLLDMLKGDTAEKIHKALRGFR